MFYNQEAHNPGQVPGFPFGGYSAAAVMEDSPNAPGVGQSQERQRIAVFCGTGLNVLVKTSVKPLWSPLSRHEAKPLRCETSISSDAPPLSDKTNDTEDFQMSITTAITVMSLPVACVAVAAALMRLFDVKDATPAESQAEAEKLLRQANQEVTIRRRVRAGAPINAAFAEFPRFPVYALVRQPAGQSK